eukprot:CAMPEP_0182905560 /NCGR_PEP_ID=MMETSP0034_2-20130328/33043_1 /TAXON_ID=156128 /ORGANISM="Nephroselmis pyriformis, Strain CCMP717" /LENGTH=37 /DNA_ID= /DNA_START= /DNA_END= /DNA_ORIENTATION=
MEESPPAISSPPNSANSDKGSDRRRKHRTKSSRGASS